MITSIMLKHDGVVKEIDLFNSYQTLDGFSMGKVIGTELTVARDRAYRTGTQFSSATLNFEGITQTVQYRDELLDFISPQAEYTIIIIEDGVEWYADCIIQDVNTIKRQTNQYNPINFTVLTMTYFYNNDITNYSPNVGGENTTETYPYKYPFTYATREVQVGNELRVEINSDNILPSPVIITFIGQLSKPKYRIIKNGKIIYSGEFSNTSVATTNRLEIDSREGVKTILLNGEDSTMTQDFTQSTFGYLEYGKNEILVTGCDTFTIAGVKQRVVL